MSKYYINDHVSHSDNKGRKKGYVKPNHKYLYRISTGDGYKYFYTLQEYQNRFKKKVADAGKKVAKAAQNGEKAISKFLKGTGKRTGKAVRKVAETLKSAGDKIVKKPTSEVKKVVDNLAKKIDQKREQRAADKRHEQMRKKNDERKALAEKTRKKREQEAADRKHESDRKRHNDFYKSLANKSVKKYNKERESHEPRDHKYLAKIQTSNGKFRYFYDQSELNAYYNKNPGQKLGDLPLKKESSTPDEDMQSVNPGFHRGSDYDKCGYTNNCYSCAATYDMRRRGYDVHSIYDENGGSDIEMMSMYKGGKFDEGMGGRTNDISTLERNMSKKYGKNSRGIMSFDWRSGGGHALAWEIDDKSKLTIYDAQANKKYSGEDANIMLSQTAPKGIYMTPSHLPSYSGGIMTMRTDDKEPSKRMEKYVCADQKESESRKDPGLPWVDYSKKHSHHED